MGKGEKTNDFNMIGPTHIPTPIDWANLEHRTAVLASLVNGVYTREEDRRKKRVGTTHSLAEPWWEVFDFTLHETLMEKDSICGAVFKYNAYDLYKNTTNTDVKVPHYVIAFRGTVLKKHTWMSDMKLNFQIIFNGLHRGRRPVDAIHKIRGMLDVHKGSPIWLAGHSLGAALVLLVGKTLAMSGFLLESYIFNPPIIWSIPSEQLYRIREIFHISKTVVIAFAGIEDILGKKIPEEDPNLASWIPYLYVNPADPVCAGSVYYFRKFYYWECRPRESRINRKISKAVRSLFFGKKKRESSTSGLSREPLHHLASADVTINKNKPTESIRAHALQQWWQEDSSQKWESLHIRPSPREDR